MIKHPITVLILEGCLLLSACSGGGPSAPSSASSIEPAPAGMPKPQEAGHGAGTTATPTSGAGGQHAAAISGAPAKRDTAASGTSGASGASGGTAPSAGMSPATGGTSGQSSNTAGVSGEVTEHSGADCGATAGALEKNEKLPDPFAMHDGTRITTKADWRCRRDEIKQDLETYEIGPKPEKPDVEASLDGDKLTVRVTTDAGSLTLSSTVSAAPDSSCVAIGMNTKSSLITGCVQVPFMHDQVVKYGNDDAQSESDPFYKVYPELWDKVGNYAAWSWGISRLIDGLITMKDALKIDPAKIAVHGCSYAGKMALFAGALDERIALTIAQESGGGGINAWRTSQDFTTRTGTNIEKIDNTSGSWFLPSMKRLDPYSLPHDHHELIALIAPRAVIAMGNQDYEWLGDESGWKSINAAKEVWKALGVEDHIGFDFTSNHTHCSAPASQVASARAFVDKFLKGKDTNTAVVIAPQEGNFDLDFKQVIDWPTPTLQ